MGMRIAQAAVMLLALLFLAPFLLFFLNTFKDKDHIYDTFHMPNLLYWDNYSRMFATSDFIPSLGYTILICLFTLLIIVLFSSMAGYIISRTRNRWISSLYLLFAAGQIVPIQTSMLPIYKIGVATGMINTAPFLILVYVAGGCAFATLLFAAFTRTIPEALEEAAAIDGCSRAGIFARIILPLLRPAAATIVVTTIYWYWNDFTGPLIYLNSGEVSPLMMTVYKFMGTNNTVDWGPVYALCFMSALPMIVFFLLTQNRLLKGLVVASVKG
ncbi:carbohydrate ABC transporter permease [Cohnella fermenti]|uniref:Carbohydrate ABC transporter permease n=1 Tax=Cohnella fermenti TaxID=2565925 RepID=A0A4S4C3C8_9BACL|nr:carbohydrate ABC transporter permease [Cohnella fermenti]THF82246.1 carbohydrate ABC transporter permease [Cohnella fermenti]